MIRLNYRPEIDALRALAVIAVIIYHAKFYLFGYLIFPGGFLGVDIFFVISGYLISSLIYKELKTNNNVDFKIFYERRARRILPALFFIIIVSIPFAWQYILPTSFINFGKSIIYSLGFSSNFFFYFDGQEYGAESGLLKPLLHTWSLSVEEQFYIIFPLIFLLVFRYLKKYIVIIFFLLAVSSLLISEYFFTNNPSLNFYLLVTRIWELLFGTMLVFLNEHKKFRINNFCSNSFVLLGLIIIILSFFLFKTSIGHPSFKSIFPVLGVMLVIYFSKANTFMNFFLSNKLFVGVGLISYSLYLWHYPIFAFYRIAFISTNIYQNGIVILIIILLSTLTYYYIEKPFRNKKKISTKKIIIVLMSSFFILLFFSFAIIKKDGFKDRFPEHGNFNLDNLYYTNEVAQKKYEIGIPRFKSPKKKKYSSNWKFSWIRLI